MLDLFRKRGVMSFVYTGLMAAVLVVFVVEFRPGSNSKVGSLSKNCVAKVRGQCVEDKEWRAQRYLLRGPYESQGTNFNKAAMDSLVERTLLEQEAARIGIRVTDDDVMNELIRGKVHVMLPASMRAQAHSLGVAELSDVGRIGEFGVRLSQFGTKEKPFDQQTFEKVVKHTTDQSVSEFTDSQLMELRAARVLDLVAERVRVSDAEAWDQYAADKSTSTIRYVRFDAGYFGDRFAELDQASLDKWADEHKADVDAREATMPKDQPRKLVHVRHVLFPIAKDATPEQKTEAKKKADDVLGKVKAGDDFAALAKDNSGDAATKDKGGVLEWSPGLEFKGALDKLKPNEASIVEMDDGLHVVQLMSKLEGKASIAFPLFQKARGDELAKVAGDRLTEALKTKLPVQLDDALKAKVEEAKKSGKNEADATTQVLDDEARARTDKTLDEVLKAMAPKEPEPPAKKPEEAKPGQPAPVPPPPKVPAWQSDDRRPRVEESSAFNVNGSPVIGLMDQQTIVDAAGKLKKEAPVSATIKASNDYFVVVLKDRHEATKDEFAKDRPNYVGAMLAKKREDAVVDYVVALRDGLGKELWIDERYVKDENKKAAPGEGQPPPMDDDNGQ